jgi:hypothetical protein
MTGGDTRAFTARHARGSSGLEEILSPCPDTPASGAGTGRAAEFAGILLKPALLLTLSGYAYVLFLVLVRATLQRVGVVQAETAQAGA